MYYKIHNTNLARVANFCIEGGPARKATSATSAKPREGTFIRLLSLWAHLTCSTFLYYFQ